MLIDTTVRPRDAGRGAHDVSVYSRGGRRHIARLYPRDAGRGIHDVQLRPANLIVAAEAGGGGGFPTQYAGFKIKLTGSTIELCMVATADAPTGMGGQVRVKRESDTLALYLVETSDPNASGVRLRTVTGVKAVRRKT